jgi:HEAT repeat protein
VEPLIWVLKDEDEFVRERAADALGRICDERAVWSLREAVSDDCEDVKVTAKEALVKIGKRR